MEKVLKSLSKIIISFCGLCSNYAYPIIVVTCLVVGILFAIPNEKFHEAAKGHIGWVFIGVIFIVGCVAIGKAITGLVSF